MKTKQKATVGLYHILLLADKHKKGGNQMLMDNPSPRIDLLAIPDFRRIDLAKGALALTEQVFSMPGAEERYQAWLKERKARQRRTAQAAR